MKIISVHNFYQSPGGEDQVFAAECRLLESHGHVVVRLTENNDRIAQLNRIKLAKATIWNGESYQRILELVKAEKPEIVHFHNTFPVMSPSCYYAARRAGAAVVQTLHNYRLICPGATLLRDGKPCEDCVARVPWRGVVHACYRNNRMASAGVAAMLTIHRRARTWQNAVDAYIALTEFSRSRFVAGGLSADRVYVKPNFMDSDPGLGFSGEYILFAGRLSPEKGIHLLVEAWRARPSLPPLHIIGDGPLGPWLKEQLPSLNKVVWKGHLSRERVIIEMQNAKALILPSIWYENFPVSVVEAYATGLPVIASDAGTLPEIVRDGTTGVIFRSGDALDLADKVQDLGRDSEKSGHFREASRSEFERYYQGNRNHHLLLEIYRRAIENRASARS